MAEEPALCHRRPLDARQRYRLLTDGEREAFLAARATTSSFASYAQVAEWLAGGAEDARGGEDEDDAEEAGFGGLALFELHLQDYLHRHWAEAFPGLALHRGDEGREFVTRDPPVGVLDSSRGTETATGS